MTQDVKNDIKKAIQVNTIPLVAIMTAVTTVLTMFVKIPTPTRGYLNLSDTMIFFSSYAFGPWVGGIIGGRITDNWRHAGTAALGQAISGVGLLLVFLVPGNHVSAAIFTFWIAFGLFFISAPQQLLMTESGKGGGELLAGAAVQVAFNFGNAVGSMVGGGMLNLSGMNYHFTALGGVPLAVIAVALLTIYSMRHETHTDALERMREITV